ncbi:hypothetical protein BH23CHL2_BH23CHL2_31510 [soil metagenome]
MTTEIGQSAITNTIRRMLRILGAMPAHVSDPEAVERAARFVHDRMARSDENVDWYQPEGYSPLVVAGNGPILLATYMDDADPFASNHSGQPPSFRDTIVSGPGILRKAGVVAAVVAELDMQAGSHFTLVIETDRNRGSLTLEQWLRANAHRYRGAIWEAIDLPILAPTIIHSASGYLTLRITASADHHFAEMHYGGVINDIGRSLSDSLSQLVTEDHEVRLDEFYDGIDDVDPAAMEIYQEFTGGIAGWLRRIATSDAKIPMSHLAMGVFLAPGVVVRSFQLFDRQPYLPVEAEAVIDIHLVPGQDARTVGQSAMRYFEERVPGARIETLLLRPPVVGKANLAALREAYPRVVKSVPGPNPAGLIESFGIPTVGYASVGRNPENTSGRITIEDAVNGARFVQTLARRMAGDATPPNLA